MLFFKEHVQLQSTVVLDGCIELKKKKGGVNMNVFLVAFHFNN